MLTPPSSAWAATKIKSVKIQIRVEDIGEDSEPELDVMSKSDKYEVVNTEITGGYFDIGEGPGARQDETVQNQENGLATCEIELCAEDDYSFNIMEQKDIKLSGIEAVCTKAVRKDNGSTLILTIELPGLQD